MQRQTGVKSEISWTFYINRLVAPSVKVSRCTGTHVDGNICAELRLWLREFSGLNTVNDSELTDRLNSRGYLFKVSDAEACFSVIQSNWSGKDCASPLWKGTDTVTVLSAETSISLSTRRWMDVYSKVKKQDVKQTGFIVMLFLWDTLNKCSLKSAGMVSGSCGPLKIQDKIKHSPPVISESKHCHSGSFKLKSDSPLRTKVLHLNTVLLCIITSGAQCWSIACFVCSNLFYIYEDILWLCQPLCICHIEANPPHEWREHNTATHTRTQTWEPVQMYSVSTVEAQWVNAFFGDSCSNYMFIDNCSLVESSGYPPG